MSWESERLSNCESRPQRRQGGRHDVLFELEGIVLTVDLGQLLTRQVRIAVVDERAVTDGDRSRAVAGCHLRLMKRSDDWALESQRAEETHDGEAVLRVKTGDRLVGEK